MKKVFFVSIFALLFSVAASAQDMESATTAFNNGVTALKNGDMAGAVAGFEDALAQAQTIGPDANEIADNCKKYIPACYLQMAKGQINEKNYDAAVENLNKVIAKAQEFAVADAIDDDDEAKDLISKVEISKGQALMNSKDFAGAMEAFKAVVSEDSSNGQAWLYLGMSAQRAGAEDVAVDAYAKAAENGQKDAADKELCKYYYSQCANNFKAKKMDAALEYGKKAIAFEGQAEAVKALSLCGKAAYSSNKFADAVSFFEQYLAKNPQAKDANQTLYQIADSYEKLGQKSKACGYYKQIPASDANFGAFAAGKVKELGC